MYRRMLRTPRARNLQSGMASRPRFAASPADQVGSSDDHNAASRGGSPASVQLQGKTREVNASATELLQLQKSRSDVGLASPDVQLSKRDEAMLEQIAALACTDTESLQKAAASYPELLDMREGAVAGRLLELKRILPGVLRLHASECGLDGALCAHHGSHTKLRCKLRARQNTCTGACLCALQAPAHQILHICRAVTLHCCVLQGQM